MNHNMYQETTSNVVHAYIRLVNASLRVPRSGPFLKDLIELLILFNPAISNKDLGKPDGAHIRQARLERTHQRLSRESQARIQVGVPELEHLQRQRRERMRRDFEEGIQNSISGGTEEDEVGQERGNGVD